MYAVFALWVLSLLCLGCGAPGPATSSPARVAQRAEEVPPGTPTLVLTADSGAPVEKIAIDDAGDIIVTAHSRRRRPYREWGPGETYFAPASQSPLRVWDRATGELRAQLPRPTERDAELQVEFMRGSARYLLVQGDVIQIYDLRSAEKVFESNARAVNCAPRGEALAFYDGSQLCVWTLVRGRDCREGAQTYAWSAGGQLAYVRAGDAPFIEVLDPSTGRSRRIAASTGNAGSYATLLWHPDGHRLLAERTRALEMIDVERDVLLWRAADVNGTFPVFANGGRTIMVTESGSSAFLAADTGDELRSVSGAQGSALLRDNAGAIVLLRNRRSLRTIDPNTGRLLATVTLHSDRADPSTGGGRVLCLDHEYPGALTHPDGRIEAILPARAGALSSNGSWLALALDDGSIGVRPASGGELEVTPIVAPDLVTPIHHLTWSEDGGVLAFAQGSHVMRFFTDDAQTRTATLDERGVFSVALSFDGHILAAGGWGPAVVWDQRGSEVLRQEVEENRDGQGAGVHYVALSADGELLVTRAHFLPVEQRELGSMGVFEPPFRLCPDGRTLLGSDGASIVAYDVATRRLAHLPLQAEQRANVDYAACTRDGQFVATPESVWAVADQRRIAMPDLSGIVSRAPYHVRPGAEPSHLVVESEGDVAVLDLASSSVVVELHSCRRFAPAIAGFGACVADASISLRGPELEREIALGARVTDLAWRPGTHLLAVAADGLWWVRPDGARLRLLVVPVAGERRLVAMDEEGHFDGPDDALSRLWVRFGDGADSPRRRLSDLPSFRRELFREWLQDPRCEGEPGA